MKLSVSWIFDHIDADWNEYSTLKMGGYNEKEDNWKDLLVKKIVETFNKTTAEIEGFKHITYNFNQFTLGSVTNIQENQIKVFSSEHNKEYTLPYRSDCTFGLWYMIVISPEIKWAQASDFHSSKEGLLPAFCAPELLRDGSWKHSIDPEDYILEVDNKSITHRPDMWGHRGFAREIAAFLNLPLKPLDSDFLEEKRIMPYKDYAPSSEQCPVSIKIEDQQACRRFAGLYCPQVVNAPSSVWMALRLLLVDSKPVDALVDITNYVMFDLSQPMHVFDADKLADKTLVTRFAKNGEKLVLLGGAEISLTSEDYVVADGKNPVALAGIKGGKESGVSLTTQSIFLEAACFNAGTIRKSSVRHKIRTDASARFEKTLDPNQNVDAIRRFLHLCEDSGIAIAARKQIISLGALETPRVINISHSFIEKRIGTQINRSFVIDICNRLGFETVFEQVNDDIKYQITVPTFRSTKEITHKEDLVEEIARFYGYDNIPLSLPYQQKQFFDLSSVFRVRALRCFMANVWQAHEVYNYAFYDESLIHELGFEPVNTPIVQSPVSENWRRLVGSLVPNLLKNIKENCATYQSLRFFEWGRVWQQQADQITEKKRLAAVFYEAKEQLNFYDIKSLVERLCDSLSLTVEYVCVASPEQPWFMPYQTADLIHAGEVVGRIGLAHHLFTQKLFEGNVFIIECDGDFLLTYRHKTKIYKPSSKFPHVQRDVSIFVPLAVTVDRVCTAIKMVDQRIIEASLVDFFEKAEWHDKRSLTIRYTIEDNHKTLTTQEVDLITEGIYSALKNLGATIR